MLLTSRLVVGISSIEREVSLVDSVDTPGSIVLSNLVVINNVDDLVSLDVTDVLVLELLGEGTKQQLANSKPHRGEYTHWPICEK